jgi:hypothetical protein
LRRTFSWLYCWYEPGELPAAQNDCSITYWPPISRLIWTPGSAARSKSGTAEHINVGTVTVVLVVAVRGTWKA